MGSPSLKGESVDDGRRVNRRRNMVLALGVVMILAGQLVFASGASAVTATSASVTMTSEPGDYIGAGLTYSYSTENGDVFSSTSDGNAVHAALTGANWDWWYLDFAAPAGQQLTPGVYLNATRYPFQAPSEPGLDVSGNGRGCNMLTGSFEVLEATTARTTRCSPSERPSSSIARVNRQPFVVRSLWSTRSLLHPSRSSSRWTRPGRSTGTPVRPPSAAPSRAVGSPRSTSLER